jgi:CubicO group peptidase (beta-lactamase class C family)
MRSLRRCTVACLLLPLLGPGCRSGPGSAPLAARIDDALTRMVPFGLSGTVLVADDDGVVLSKGYGAGLRSDTIYDMGSITKTFTATAIRMLEADGKLGVDDPLTKYFDDVPADKVGITLRQLLSHTAGVVDLPDGDYDPISRTQLVTGVLQAPLKSQPGTEYHYSNAGR